MNLAVEPLRVASRAAVDALNRLLPQLHGPGHPMGVAELSEVVADRATSVFLARRGDEIVGTATVAVYRTPGGVRARIHDVVVDERARRGGVGSALVTACIGEARRRGAVRITLGVSAERTAANALYKRLGFEVRDQVGYVWVQEVRSEVRRQPG